MMVDRMKKKTRPNQNSTVYDRGAWRLICCGIMAY